MTDVKIKLEFDKIVEKIAGLAYTDTGRNEVSNLHPIDKLEDIIAEGKYVSEAKEILINHDYPPIDYLPDLSEALFRSKIKGNVLDIREIHYILKLAQTSRKLFQFINNRSDGSDSITLISKDLFIDKVFENAIERVFDDKGEISDNASENLRSIRKKIIERKDALRKTVNRILKTLSEKYLVQEEYITQRDGRIVLPVKAEHKRHVRGFIHSESATGQTVYIEPEETLEMNNDILSLSFAEKREIEKILGILSGRIGEKAKELLVSSRIISRIDSVFARARYSIEIIGSFPTFDHTKSFQIINGKHPVLIKKLGMDKTVPLNIEIKNDRVIIITGPNAGGKTVALKTFGLLVLLALSGIHVPVHPDSNFHFIDKILVDIGDEQSIEDDLSTFSSHLTNIHRILNTADEKTLVLLDEIGTGTDPAEGAAMATAILIKLKEKKSIVLASTHHGNLKIIANSEEGFQNASMEFDNENLIPTYKFRQGIPGSSYAFEVAGRIGFNDDFIRTAKEYLDSGKNRVEELIIALETKSKILEEKLRNSEIENSRLNGLTKLYEDQLKKLKEQKQEIIKKAKDEADQYVKNINREFESTIKKIKETNADKSVIKEEKKKIEKIKNDVVKLSIMAEKEEMIDGTINIGDYVKLKDTFTEGKIIEMDRDKNTAVILSGNIKLKVKLGSLLKTKKQQEEVSETTVYANIFTANQSLSLDIRGRKPEEVDYEILRFIDDGVISNNKRLEIIHGKGTGVLKKTVKDLLSKHDSVKKFYYANIEYGGDGVTIVEL